MRDLMGDAIWDFYHENSPKNLLTETTISDLEVMSVEYLFREFDKMNIIEKKAMSLTRGKVLDVGSGAGAHSLYLQEDLGLDVTALEISNKASEVCKLRGINKVVCMHLLDFPEEKFDTILLLMNGTGIFGKVNQVGRYLNKLNDLLKDDGQILIDSTDLIYMYNELNGLDLPIDKYYGEVEFTIYYKEKNKNLFRGCLLTSTISKV